MIALLLAAQLAIACSVAHPCGAPGVSVFTVDCETNLFIAKINPDSSIGCGYLNTGIKYWIGRGSVTMPMPPPTFRSLNLRDLPAVPWRPDVLDCTKGLIWCGAPPTELWVAERFNRDLAISIHADEAAEPASLNDAHAICERHYQMWCDGASCVMLPEKGYAKDWLKSCNRIKSEWDKGADARAQAEKAQDARDKAFVEGVAKSLEQQK